MALHAYHDRYESFPPAYLTDADGQPMHSWRVLLLPFLGHKDLVAEYSWEEPWDGPNNRRLADRTPPVYRCPAASATDAGVTNYFAVVGPETAWPENHAVAVRNFHDGTASTILVVESRDTGNSWLAPRDLSSDAAAAGVNPALHPSISSGHKAAAHVLFADGTVRRLKDWMIDESVLRTLLSINGGRPLEGVDWPPEKLAGAEEFPPTVLAGELTETEILPHTRGPITPGRNYLYCATFQLAWNELQDQIVGAPIRLEGSPPMADELNRQSFRSGSLSDDSYVAMAGRVKDGIADEIRSAMNQKFPAATPKLIEYPDDTVFFAYAYLQKTLPFPVKFDRLPKPLQFQAKRGRGPVASFGIQDFDEHGLRAERLTEQVTILDYVSDDDFVLRLSTKTDEIILAKVTPQKSLADTIDAVMQRILQPIGKQVQPTLQKKESLVMPKIALNIDREYSEIVGNTLQNQGWSDFYIGGAMQSTRFLLNESGARLESEAWIAVANGDPPPPPKPRHFVFDRPFLIYLRELQAEQPYLAIWVESPELLVRAKAE
jgi:hypothetical protein